MKKIILIILLTGCISNLYSQEDAVLDSAVLNITKQVLFFPHEKIYLHTDKPYYITGEKIFFRAFLLEACSNKQIALSRYVYVELINPADSVVNRVKIRHDESFLFHGIIPLSEDLQHGIYKIRAYTQYMRNQGESAFFSKYVRINDPHILEMETESDFFFDKDGKVNTSLRFIDAKSKEVMKPQSVTLRVNRDRPFSSKTDNEGWVHVKLNVPENASTRALYVEVTANNRLYRHFMQIPYPEGTFDVSFYPEGGNLIAGQTSNIAFKAVNANGAAIDVSGEIIDSKGDIVAQFKTFHDGMGEFFLNPLPDERYHAICRNGENTRRVDLPEAKINTFSLRTTFRDNKVWISVNKYASALYPKLYLMIHSGGVVVYAKTWDSSKEFITISKKNFFSGINNILLLTEDLQIVSERLVFIQNNDAGIVEFQTQKPAYTKREQIETGIRLIDNEQQPLKGNFSIAVTNDNEVIQDTTTSILSEILLRSELRGSIDNPDYYFQTGNKNAEIAADLLMKTHGWRRYAIPEALRGELSLPSIPFEISQQIAGTVKSGLFSRLANQFQISLISLSAGYFDLTETDKEGRFIFQNFEFPDSTNYVVQALNSKGKGRQMTELFIDDETFPEILGNWTNLPIQNENVEEQVLLDYITKADLHYTYVNGMRMINLPEVEIKARRGWNDNKYKSSYYFSPDYSMSDEDIEKFHATDIKSLLYRIPGVMVMGDNISIRGSQGEPLIIVDEVPFEGMSAMEILNSISVFDVGQLDVLKNAGNLAVFGTRGANGVIVIHTKRGEIRAALPFPNIKSLLPLGYQSPVEFYSPKYDTQERINDMTPDLRTTIYWNPAVVTDDEGNVKLDFYTSDDTATYSITIEGVSEDGVLIHYRGKSVINVE